MHQLQILSKQLLLVLCIYTITASSQTNSFNATEKDKAFEIGFSQNLTSNIQPKHWSIFASSYNEVAKPISPLGNFKNVVNYDLNFRFRFLKYFVYCSYQHVHRKCEATYNFNESRTFRFKNNALSFGIGKAFVTTLKHKLTLSWAAGIRFGGEVLIESEYKYRDGLVSYGGDKDLNGTYYGHISLGGELGVILKYKVVKGLKFESSLFYQFNNNVASSDMTDLSGFKTLNPGNHIQVIYLPEDYKTYDPNNLGYYAGLKSAFNGYKFNFGLSYEF